jgi:hypothetical protein
MISKTFFCPSAILSNHRCVYEFALALNKHASALGTDISEQTA